MKSLLKPLWLLGLMASVSFAEPTSVISGSLDLRPSWSSSQGKVHSENELALNLRLAPNWTLGLVQEFGIAETLQAFDGYMKLSREAITKNLSVHARWYAPIHSEERAAGFQTAFRTDFQLEFPVSSVVSLLFIESPRWNWYSQPNKNFENRFEIATTLSLLKESLNVKMALLLENVRQADNSWLHKTWLSPEALYSVNETTALGVAYYSENLMTEDLSSFAISEGFRSGVFQIVLQQTL